MSNSIDIQAEVDPQTETPQQTQAVAVRQTGGAVGPAQPQPAQAPITPAQAKVDAIASLTMKAYDRAATLQITPEEAARLSADFPDEAFKPGAAGKEHLLYIEHAFLRDRLCEVFGLGQWAIVPRNRWTEPFTTAKGTPGERVYVEAMLIIRGCFVGEAVGAMEYYPKNESQNYGDAVEGAKTAAFRRCAKELGVGLQAWKKDWCDGWWARKRGGRDFSQKRESSQKPVQGAGSSPGLPRQGPGPKTSATSQQQTQAGTKKAAETPQTPFPSEATRKWFLDELQKTFPEHMQEVAEFFEKAGILLPNENLTDIPLRWVPNSRAQLRQVGEAIGAFAAGDEAKMPYASHPEPGEPKKKAEPKKETAAPSAPAGKPAGKDPEWWRDVIIPIPPKGVKKADYLKNPETIGMIYDLRHEQTADAQELRQRLWGFLTHYEPKPWTKTNGEVVQPSQADFNFREALDAFGEYLEKHGEKL